MALSCWMRWQSLECPRIPELEDHLGQAGKNDSAPTVWLTAIVHLATGVPFSWRFGKGTASERHHLRHLLKTLPEKVLVVCDAGYTGYELVRDMMAQGVDFLIRMSSTVTLYTEKNAPLRRFREGSSTTGRRRRGRKAVCPCVCG